MELQNEEKQKSRVPSDKMTHLAGAPKENTEQTLTLRKNSETLQDIEQTRTVSSSSSQISSTQNDNFPVDLPNFNQKMFQDMLIDPQADLLQTMIGQGGELELQEIKTV